MEIKGKIFSIKPLKLKLEHIRTSGRTSAPKPMDPGSNPVPSLALLYLVLCSNRAPFGMKLHKLKGGSNGLG